MVGQSLILTGWRIGGRGAGYAGGDVWEGRGIVGRGKGEGGGDCHAIAMRSSRRSRGSLFVSSDRGSPLSTPWNSMKLGYTDRHLQSDVQTPSCPLQQSYEGITNPSSLEIFSACRGRGPRPNLFTNL